MPRLTHKQYKERIREKFGSRYQLLSKYSGTKTPIEIECPVHGETTVSPISFLKIGCRQCRIDKRCKSRKMSKLEKGASVVLKASGIKYKREHQIKKDSNRRYDFYFRHRGKDVILELDGIQHLKASKRFKRQSLAKRQQIDREKTFMAIEEGYIIIRIDYTRLKHLKKDITEILNSKMNFDISLSNYEKYAWLFAKGWKNKRKA